LQFHLRSLAPAPPHPPGRAGPAYRHRQPVAIRITAGLPSPRPCPRTGAIHGIGAVCRDLLFGCHGACPNEPGRGPAGRARLAAIAGPSPLCVGRAPPPLQSWYGTTGSGLSTCPSQQYSSRELCGLSIYSGIGNSKLPQQAARPLARLRTKIVQRDLWWPSSRSFSSRESAKLREPYAALHVESQPLFAVARFLPCEMEDVCDPHLIEYDFRRDGLADFTSQGCVILGVFAYGKRCTAAFHHHIWHTETDRAAAWLQNHRIFVRILKMPSCALTTPSPFGSHGPRYSPRWMQGGITPRRSLII
jgi:hypothetical protein